MLAAVFAGWHRETGWQVGSFVAFVLFAALTLFLYQKRWRAQDSLVAKHEARRREAEDTLRESEARYHKVVSSLTEGVVSHARDGAIMAWNPSAEKILGLTGEQLNGRMALDPRWRAIHEDGTPFPGEMHPASKTLRTGAREQNVIMGVHKPDDSLTWISINAVPTFVPGDAMPSGVVVSFSDITEVKLASEELARHHYHLEDLVASRTVELTKSRNKAEAAHQGKSRFLAAASHDLQQPLFAAQLFVAGLASTLSDDVHLYSIKKVQQALKMMSGELKLLLELSRLEDATFVIDKHDKPAIELFDLMRDTYDQKALQANVRLLFHPGEFVLHTDSGMLSRLLGNLIDNAIKFSPGGTVLVCARRSKDGHVIQVRDNGLGIATINHEAVFDDFCQVDNTERNFNAGYGLGLSIVVRIARLLGSEIHLASAVGRGSTFAVVMPTSP